MLQFIPNLNMNLTGCNPFMQGLPTNFTSFNPFSIFSGAGFNTPVFMPFMPPIVPMNFSFGNTSSNEGSSDSINIQGEKLNKKGAGYGKEFLDKVKQIASRVNCDYKDLLAVMNSESKLSTTATNPVSGAVGLIQIMPDTAKVLGTSVAALKKMSPVEQLDYVEKYINLQKRTFGFTNKRLSAGELYGLTYRPAKVKSGVLATRGEKAYSYGGNDKLDTNKDGKITVAEMDARVKANYISDNSFLA